MAITAKDVMELRKQTDCGMMECKKALTEADGNFEKAIEILRERGLATAAKKASRTLLPRVWSTLTTAPSARSVLSSRSTLRRTSLPRTTSSSTSSRRLLKVIMKQNPADVEALMACKTEAGETVDEALKNLILVIKENIKIRRFTRYEGVCSAYVHGGGTHGILVNFETTHGIEAKDEFVTYGKDIAMQVAAANPGYVDEASVPAEVVAKEKEIMLAQMAGDPKTANKPEAVKQKMIEGKIKKFFKENCLVDQEFVKDGDLTVAQYTPLRSLRIWAATSRSSSSPASRRARAWRSVLTTSLLKSPPPSRANPIV